MIYALFLLSSLAFAGAPTDLDDLVAVALDRDPEVAALGHDADATRSRSVAASRPMPAELMFGAEAIGAPKDSMDPTMLMLGISQMFRGYGEARAWRDRLLVDASRSDADRERVEADLRTTLWKLAASIRAKEDEQALLDDQIRTASALTEIGLLRYQAGGSGGMPAGSGPMPGMGTAMTGAMPGMTGPRPPVVQARGSDGGMSSMGGMGGGGGEAARSTPPGSAATTGPASATSPMAGGEGLSALLRLDAEVARLQAERVGLGAELAGDLAVLRALVGEEAATVVADSPSRFLGAPEASDVPERHLAALDRDAAEATVKAVHAGRFPDWMVSVGERFMPDEMGMPGGTDLSVGVQLPLWGAQRHELDAARADAEAAEARAARVDRELAIVRAQARAAWEGATARASGLESSAVPRAQQAWALSQALYAASRMSADEAIRAWESTLQIQRDAVAARRDVELRAADLARLGGE